MDNVNNENEFKVLDAWAMEPVEIESPAKCFDCQRGEDGKCKRQKPEIDNEVYVNRFQYGL